MKPKGSYEYRTFFLVTNEFIHLFNRDHTVKHSHNTKPVTDAQDIEFVAANLQFTTP